METSELVDLQLHTDGEEPEVASHTEGQKSLEQPDVTGRAVGNTMTSRWKKIYLSVSILVGYASVYAAMATVTAFYAIVAQNHNVPTYISGFVIGVPNLCVSLLAPFIGYFLPHLGLKFTQVAGLFLTGGSEILFGFVSKMPTPTLFISFSLLLKVAEGTGYAMYATASLTMLTQLYLQRKGTLACLIELSAAIGTAIGVPVGGGLQQVGGFVLPLLVFGGINLTLTLLLLINVHPTECTSAKVPWHIVFMMLKNILFALLVLCALISLGTYFSLTAYFGHFLSTHFGLSVGVIGVIYLSGLTMNTLASVSAGPIADKLRIPRYLVIGGLVVAFVGCVLIGPPTFITTPKLWLSILAWVVFQTGIAFAVVPVYPAIFEAITNLQVEEAVLASTLSGILVTSYSAGGFLGPVFGGGLLYQIQFPWMAAISGLILLITALVLVIATVIVRIWRRKMNTNERSCGTHNVA